MPQVRHILTWYVGACATLVLIIQGLSSVRAIAVQPLVIAAGVALLGALVAVRPRPSRPRLRLRNLPHALDPLPSVAPFVFALPLIVAMSFALGWHVPPNNWDSMTYHLSRAAYWRQWHTLAHFPTNDPRQDVFPGNAEILVLVTLLLAHTADFAFLVQFTAYLAAIVAIYGLGRLLRLRPAYALIGAGAFGTMPEVVLQSTSTQNDLTVAAFVICAAYFFVDAVLKTRLASIVFMGAALGLAVGTKPTALLVLPGLGLGAVVVLLHARYRLRLTRHGMAALAGGVLLAVLLGAPWYISNRTDYGNVSGPPSIIAIQEATHPTVGSLSTHLWRYMISFIDPGWSAQLNPAVAQQLCGRTTTLDRSVGALAHLPTVEPAIDSPGLVYAAAASCTYNEDLSWFGMMGWLAIMAAFGWTIIGVATRKLGLPWMLGAGVTSFFLCASYLLRWNPWEGRLFIMAVALGSPLLGLIAARVSRRVSGRIVLQLAVLYAAITGLGAATYNTAKPVSAWGANSATMQVATRPNMGPIIERVNRTVPAHGRLGIFLQIDDWDYPLFGPHLDRIVEPLVLSTYAHADAPIPTPIHTVLTHQPGSAVAALFREQHLTGCHSIWTIETSDSAVPWKLFACTSRRGREQPL